MSKFILAHIFGLLLFGINTHAEGIDLHAHLFMKKGMGLFFKGDFTGPLRASSWQDRFKSQVNPETLEKSGLDIVVATLYAHPFFVWSLRDSIRNQVKLANEFVQTHPQWVIAKTAKEAQAAYLQNKKVMILALEGAAGILENEEDFKEFLDQDGIRIVAPLHLTDDTFGGVAFLKNFRAWSNPIQFLKNLISPDFDENHYRVNSNGLSQSGRQLIKALIKRRIWIDLAHSSDASQREIFQFLEKAKQPPLYTHTVLRKYHGAERGISTEQLYQVAKNKGYIGLMPSEEMLAGTPSPKALSCDGSVGALFTQIHETATIIGKDAVSIGSDTNGGIPHLKPSCNTKTNLDDQGFWNMAQFPELWEALREVKNITHDSKVFSKVNTQYFLETWEKIWK